MNKAQKRILIDTPINVAAFLLTAPLWYLIGVMAFGW